MIKSFIHIPAAIFLGKRFYLACSLLILLFTAGFFTGFFFLMGKLGLLIFILAVIVDFYLLFLVSREPVLFTREIPEKLSNTDENKISVYIKNNHIIPLAVAIFDELPVQLQIRNFQLKATLTPYEEKHIDYFLTPKRRGEYIFGRSLLYISTTLGLIKRRLIFNRENKAVPVYPSFLNIRKFEFLAISNRLTEAGIKRIRRIGQHSEFDQIRDYVRGDDLRTVNWKATAKKGRLMANQYQDERSQQIYNIIDMGRLMEMPFDHVSLLDYAINSSLVLSNTALFKHDKVGMITFNTDINTFMPAERKMKTMADMLERLYKQETLFAESNYELLFVSIKRLIPQRSLLIMYTNFESLASLQRQIPNLQKLTRNHLLLIIIFENSEISEFRKKEAQSLEDIYVQTIAEKFMYDKKLILKELNKHGIISLLTRPADLSVNLINKYLELKDRNLI